MEYLLVDDVFFCKLRPDFKKHVVMEKKFSFMVMPLLLTLLMALVFMLERLLGLSFVESGIYPRSLPGLKGILFAPFVHGDVEHLLSNLSALPILLGMLAMGYRRNYMRILFSLWMATGLMVWVMGRDSYHIGVSGVIYALASFLLFGGIISGRRLNVAITLVVIFLYGGMVWGLLPEQPHISWESHLFGGVAGFAAAFVFAPTHKVRKTDDADYDYKMPGFGDADVSAHYDSVVYEYKNNITNI